MPVTLILLKYMTSTLFEYCPEARKNGVLASLYRHKMDICMVGEPDIPFIP